MVDAIYTRQSVDRADSISIESQLEFCKYETKGGEFNYYSDRGFSGKNTDRPDFQRMMSDIKAGKIKRVIVYKLDRISRSILDFTAMMEEFHKYGVEFVSCTEKFDTSSPMGRAMLTICVTFAQLERETIQMRVADAYASRSKHGFYMGGRVPFGYQLVPYTIDGKRTSCYSVIPEEAEIIKFIFEQYSQPMVSLNDITLKLNQNSLTTKLGNPWEGSMVAAIIKNPVYVRADLDLYEFFKNQGANIVNDPIDFIGTNGCYLYNTGSTKSKRLSLDGQTLVIAPHEGIIPADIWMRARQKCLNNKSIARATKAKNSWLIGKVKCGKCGHSLVVRINNNGANKYILCSYHVRTHACEGIGCIDGIALEDFVLGAMKERLTDFDTLSMANEERINPQLTELRIKEEHLQKEIDAVMDKIADANGVLMDYINKRITELDSELTAVRSKIREISVVPVAYDMNCIRDYMSHWDELAFDDKRTVVDILISRIDVTKESVEITWKV